MKRLLAILLLPLILQISSGEERNKSVDEIRSVDVVTPLWGETRQGSLDVLPHRVITRPRIGLVLSGGGSRGLAQIGVLQVLEQNNIPIDFIVGTSMGSLVGALYALGYSTDDMIALSDTLEWDDVVSLTDYTERRDMFIDQKIRQRRGVFTIRFDGIEPVIPSGLTPAQRLTSFINQLVLQGIYYPHETFDNLRIPLRVVAADLIRGERVVFNRGDLVQAIRASISVPLVFSPVRRDTLLLVDGGIISNIPVDVARDFGCDFVIAVNTTSGLRPPDAIGAPWEIADQIVTIMQQRWNYDQLKLANVIITPPIEDYIGTDFRHRDLFIKEGKKSAEGTLEELIQKLDTEYKKFIGVDSLFYSNPVFVLESSYVPSLINESFSLLSESSEISHGELVKFLNEAYETGYYSDVYARVEKIDTAVAISIHLTPHREIEEIIFQGNTGIDSDKLEEYFLPLVGFPLNTHHSRAALEKILRAYREKGYSLADISSVDFDDQSGILTVDIDEGEIGSIRIEGNNKTRSYVIRREFTLKPGDVFQVGRAMQGIRNISGTGLFTQVLLNVDNSRGGRELIISVEEKHSDFVRLSMHVDETYHIQPLIEFRNENILGNAIEGGLSFGGGLDNRIYQGDIVVHRIFNTHFTARLANYYLFEDIDVYLDDPASRREEWKRLKEGRYKQIRWGGNLSIGTQFERLGNILAGFRIERQRIKELEPGDFLPTEHTLVAHRLSAIFDTQDKIPFPTEGINLHAFYETGLSVLGSDISYSKFFFNFESFTTYNGIHTIRPRVIFGIADETLPLTEFFSLGGKDSFFGLPQYDSRGRQIFLVNLEYRAKLPFRVIVDTYVYARYDVGAMWKSPEDIHIGDLRHGIGIGLGFDTIIFGPLEFAVGRAYQSRGGVRDQPIPAGPVHTYFSIGFPIF